MRLLHLPLGFHTGVHSGRLLKTMLDGSSGMASVWLSFLREHCASFVSLFVLLPMTLFINTDGTLAHRRLGAMDEAALRSNIEKYLKVPSA